MERSTAAPVPIQFPPLPARVIFNTWWPLAFSWLLMNIEIPAISAVIARLSNPEINLAAYGGVVYPLALIIEAPIIMLLGASTALTRHRQAYRLIWQYMTAAGAILTALHILIAYTPLYYFIVDTIIGAPKEIVEPARLGLMVMLPWTWSIGYRRFNQGVMIRFGHSGLIGVGTLIRLVAGSIVLLAGYSLYTFFGMHNLPGILVGAVAQTVGVLSEAIYTAVRVRPILRMYVNEATVSEPLTWRAFAAFYIPLALTSLIQLLWQPVGSAALSRMPAALSSLAVWPVLTGLISMLRSPGTAFNEVTVAMLDRPRAFHSLKRFAAAMAITLSALQLLISATPLAYLYFANLSALPRDLAAMASLAFWMALPMPALAVLQSWFQGTLLHSRQTRGVPESVTIFFVTVLLILAAGVAWGKGSGLNIAMLASVIANFAQMGWLWLRSRPARASLVRADSPAE